MFDVEIESLRWFSTFTQRSLGDVEEVEIAPAAELAAEHRELAEIAALEDEANRPDIAELLPVERFGALLDLLGEDTQLMVAAEEELAPALSDHWTDVSRGVQRRGRPPPVREPRADRSGVASARADLAVVDLRAARRSSCARRPPTPPRARWARPSPSSRSSCAPATARSSRSPSAARASARPTTSVACRRAGWARACPGRRPPGAGAVAALCHGVAARGLRRALAEARGLPRAPPAAPPPRRARTRPDRRQQGGGQGGPRRGALRSFTELRTGDIVVHEDHGVARFAGFETRTVADVTRDYLYLEYQGDDRVFVPTEQLAKISRYVGGGGEQWAAAVQAGGHALGDDEGARAPRRAGAGGRAAEPVRRAPPADGPRVRAGLRLAARVRGALPVHRDARPARGDRAGEGRHGSAPADGPADLRRRRLRQDRGGAARRVQGGERGQAGADAGADDDPRPAALRHVLRAAGRLSVHARARLALSHRPPSRKRRSRASPRAASTS